MHLTFKQTPTAIHAPITLQTPQSAKTPIASSIPSSPFPITSTPTKTATNSDAISAFTRICVGRGRLLKVKELSSNPAPPPPKINILNRLTSNSPPSSQFVMPIVPQKRKSPNQLDRNNNGVELVLDADDSMDADTNEMHEISNKLKKIVCVNESENTYHNYSETPISSLMAINVDTNTDFRTNNNINNNRNRNQSLSLISDHLRRYSNCLVRMMGDNSTIPSLKAKFVAKYTGLFFPIGVGAFAKVSQNLLLYYSF